MSLLWRGKSLGIRRTFSFCLKALYGEGQALDAALGMLYSDWVLPRCPSSPFPAPVSLWLRRGRRRPWARDPGDSAAVPPVPSDIANLLGRGAKVPCECL